jgi:hypothetical protein
MKIELRNLKTAAFASEETTCFQASLYVDGKRCGAVSNDGHGGCNAYSDRDAWRKVQDYAATLPGITSTLGSESFTYQPDADSLVDAALDVALLDKQFRRLYAHHVVFLGTDGKLYNTRKLEPARKAAILAGAVKIPDCAQMLNALPYPEALARFAELQQ